MNIDVAVIGAGPHGLSVAAQLAHRGVDVRTFGPPMATWREHMPAAMLLKSDGFASNLTPGVPGWSLQEYCERVGAEYGDTEPRVPLARFCEYGVALQRELVPNLDTRLVANVAPVADHYELTLEDGEQLTARRVVVATGITHFAEMPAALSGLGQRVTHTSAHRDFEHFASERVAVIGAGSSAILTAAHLVDAGAETTVIARRDAIPFWAPPQADAAPPTWWDRVKYPTTGLGPGWRNKLCEDLPDVFRMLPAQLRLRIVRGHLGPSSPWWLRGTVIDGATVLTRTELRGARESADAVTLDLVGPEGEVRSREFDRVICGTGYRASLDKLPFLDQSLVAGLARVGDMPQLTRHFESSAPGLFFVGSAASGTFGPLLRFVVGTKVAAPRVAARLARLARHTSRRPEPVLA